MDVFRNSEKGMALPAVIMVMLITFTLSAAVLTMGTSQAKTEITYESNTQALQAAEAGLNMYLWYINKEGSSIELDTVITYPDTNPKYAFVLHEIEATNAQKKVTSTGWSINNPDIKKTVSAVFKRKTFTEYVYFTHEEPSPIWWMTGEKCYGPLRTNSKLYIQGRPIFYGEVYYADRIEPGTGYNPDFRKGAFHVEELALPTSNTTLAQLAKDDGLHFEGRTSIMMNNNGTLSIWNPGDGKKENPVKVYDMPKNGVIYVDNIEGADSNNIFDKKVGNVFISGNLKGRLTVAAANNIYITDYNPTIEKFNQTRKEGQTNGVNYVSTSFYKQEDGFIAIGNDMLGLIANNDVILHTEGWFDDTKNKASKVADGDINVYAAVMAIEGSFKNINYDKYPTNSEKATVTLRGALIQKRRGEVGQTKTYIFGIKESTGYKKDYAHDTRMLSEQPPYFLEPASSGWEISAWQ